MLSHVVDDTLVGTPDLSFWVLRLFYVLRADACMDVDVLETVCVENHDVHDEQTNVHHVVYAAVNVC